MQVPYQDRQKYEKIYYEQPLIMGKLSSDKARNLFLQSGLSTQQLAQIWSLCATRSAGFIEKDEFVNAMFIIFSMLNGSMKSVPLSLPMTNSNVIGNNMPGMNRPSSVSSTNSSIASSGMKSSKPIDWHINSSDKVNYDNLFYRFEDKQSHTVKANSIASFLKEKGFTPAALNQAWNLIDVKREQKINKEQFSLLLHLLNLVNKGHELPHQLPIHLKNRFLGITPPSSNMNSNNTSFNTSFNSISYNTSFNTSTNNYGNTGSNMNNGNVMSSMSSNVSNSIPSMNTNVDRNLSNNNSNVNVMNNNNNINNTSSNIGSNWNSQFNNNNNNNFKVEQQSKNEVVNQDDEEDELLKLKEEELKKELSTLESKLNSNTTEDANLSLIEMENFLSFLKEIEVNLLKLNEDNNNTNKNENHLNEIEELKKLIFQMEDKNNQLKRWSNLQLKELNEFELELQKIKLNL
ncbi:hypothetical protein K502DRAFT_343326 [Neoconidiobolus thromboides FSU 785]|nr:hypothetical protein K502DRAFT_343326 [Neoconidiobolus thromboides FSU 785]